MLEEMPSTSASSLSTVEDVLGQLDEEALAPWEINKLEKDYVQFELYDGIHSIAKYTVSVNSALEFTVYASHWPIPDDHSIYNERKRSIRGDGVKELLSLVESCCLCDGLPEDYQSKSVAVNPNTDIIFQEQLFVIQS